MENLQLARDSKRRREVIFATKINSVDLNELFNDRAMALVVKNYFLPTNLHEMNEKIASSSIIEKYTHEVNVGSKSELKYYGVDRIGLALNSTYNDPNGFKMMKYKKSAHVARDYIQNIFSPFQTPIDKLQINLDHLHLEGATTGSFIGSKMPAGVLRLTNPTDTEDSNPDIPHFDSLPENFHKFSRQFAANIYLQTPDKGGALRIWDTEDYQASDSLPKSLRKRVGIPTKIEAKQGDLIIFNCRKPHAVEKFEKTIRISAQTFMGYNPSEPLQLWN